ncbi:MAG TPA: hypothetical protein DEH22_11300 [Chloroflexi bacterium]|nr:hypothetical protein [Chloroflexota bacterium]
MRSITFPTPPIPFGSASNTGTPDDIRTYLPGLSGTHGRDTLLLPDDAPLMPVQRLVMLMPAGEIDEHALIQQIWQLAAGSQLPIVYLGLEPQEEQFAAQQRRLSELAFLTSGQEVRARAIVSAEKSWPEALTGILQTGDLLVCLADHEVTNHIVGSRGLGKLLVESLSVPVYLIEDLKIGITPQFTHRIKEMLFWVSALIVVAAFFGLEYEIDISAVKPLSTTLISLAVFAEFYLVWKINRWIGQ